MDEEKYEDVEAMGKRMGVFNLHGIVGDIDRRLKEGCEAEDESMNEAHLIKQVNREDPWAHRSMGMQCKTCMFFVEKVTKAVQREDQFIGRCRRHAPGMNGYPVVFSNDWCGDHKLDETKS